MQRVNESGRSMVEMLGVLAIIGVLSVGGIAGYTSAMNKHRANETIDRLMKRAIIVSGQRLLGQEGSLSGFNTNDGTYAITLNDGASGTATTFTMTATNVPQVVCEKIKALDWKLPVISPDTCGETNNLTFTFNNDLSEGSGTEQGDKGLQKNVPCGDDFCYEGQTCVDATENDYGYECNGFSSESLKCCKSDDNTSCPPGEVYFENYMSCGECPEGGYMVDNNGTLVCCQRGTGKYWMGYQWGYGGDYSDILGSICCTSQGGHVDGDNYACCGQNGYDLQGRLNYYCLNGCSLIGKKANGKFYQIHEGLCDDEYPGCLDVSEYVQWDRCMCAEENAAFCQQAFEEGYEH